MSELAPFVAAAIRDKVVRDLQTENEQLRAELAKTKKEKIDILTQEAEHGWRGNFRTAIIGPPSNNTTAAQENRIVYAVTYAWFQNEDLVHAEDQFEVVHPCTLADLAAAQIYVNGNASRPLAELPINFSMHIESDADPEKLFGPLGVANSYVRLSLDDFSQEIDFVWIVLPFVDSKQWLEFANVDYDDLVANHTEIDIWGRAVSLHELIRFFGADTAVIFDQVAGFNVYMRRE